jgi:hypothetical protein
VPLPDGVHQHVHPLTELSTMAPHAQVIVVETPGSSDEHR